MSDNTLITVTIADSTENVTVTTEDTTPNVTVNTTETIEEVTVQVFKSLTRQQFDILIDQKMKAGNETNLSAGENSVDFPVDSPFLDADYSVYITGYSADYLTKIEAFVTNRTTTGFTVYIVDDCVNLEWIAVKH